MSSDSPISEKLALYFSTVNSLSSKIFSEVQLIDKSIAESGDSKLSYDERCAVIDKRLIKDVITSKRLSQKATSDDPRKGTEKVHFKTAVFRDEVLDEHQTDSMIRFVYPPMPEKYIFDENGCWLDEHSGPFNFCKKSQAKCCKLEEFANKLSSKAKVNDVVKISEVQLESQPQLTHHASKNLEKEPKLKKKSKAPYFGVNVMGMGINASNESIDDNPAQKYKGNETERKFTDHTASETEDESNLPNQKQNLDLIAELQAKLDRNKIRNMSCPPPPPPTDPTKEKFNCVSPPIVSSPTTTGKVCKPKAPPPPPPVQKTETKSKIIEKEKSVTSENESKEKDAATSEKKGEFMVDVSSPCRIVTPKTGFDFLDNW